MVWMIVIPLLMFWTARYLTAPRKKPKKGDKPDPSLVHSMRMSALSVRTAVTLRGFRSAASLFSVTHDGEYPRTLSQLTPERMEIMPMAVLPDHESTDVPEAYGAEACKDKKRLQYEALRDSGAYALAADPASACWGKIFVDCTHTDTRGRRWASY
jgi:hypothetical protein